MNDVCFHDQADFDCLMPVTAGFLHWASSLEPNMIALNYRQTVEGSLAEPDTENNG